MRLTNIAIMAIRGCPGLNEELAESLGVSVVTINRYLRTQDDDNLTKAAALTIIKERLGIPEDQILESVKVKVVA